MEIAGKKHQQQKSGGLMTWLIITIILGAVFLTGQMSEYVSLYKENVTISKNVFGSAFFTLTGFHGLHVFIGLIVLLIILYQVASGKYKAIEKDAFEGATIYWHFVDGVWIVVFSVIYIGAFVL
jgi:heme/copper-type cytochrome/quinol oxidase subunit 3